MISGPTRSPSCSPIADSLASVNVGDQLRPTIRRELQGCDALVVLYSSAAAQRDWVKAEIGAAWVLGKPIHVLLDKIDSRELPDVVSDYSRST